MVARARTGLHDKVLSKVKKTAGSILRIDKLREEGQLHEQRVVAEAQAEAADARAAQREEEATVVARQQALKAETERLAAEELTEIEIEQVDRSRIAGEVEIAAEAKHKEMLLARQVSEEEQTLEDTVTAAVRERQMAEIRATDLERRADEARQAAVALEGNVTDLPLDGS